MEKRLFFLLNMSQHRLYKHVDQRSEKDLGVTIKQLAALYLLAKNEGCQLKAMCDGLGLNNSAVTGLTQRLEKNALIRREACSIDRRASQLYLTEKGQSKIEAAAPLLQEMNEAIQGEFSDEEITIVTRFLNHLMERF
ncbi:DNA-binding MarR family transcriptional regulator [Sinobacterium caligoides]|uniref:DNA-binding MarR family transcriptional regulator n=1 Tax=Sinobacterium caligoides TaxID=933926 RepID=A0A3N2DKF9_9GAMM|nr:MarR family transcriptional regulator [Sinobacterium caligoides]ROS00258.1 DNA-binding MarR family transcriptional regulator [Sinobacterium caligoides]